MRDHHRYIRCTEVMFASPICYTQRSSSRLCPGLLTTACEFIYQILWSESTYGSRLGGDIVGSNVRTRAAPSPPTACRASPTAPAHRRPPLAVPGRSPGAGPSARRTTAPTADSPPPAARARTPAACGRPPRGARGSPVDGVEPARPRRSRGSAAGRRRRHDARPCTRAATLGRPEVGESSNTTADRPTVGFPVPPWATPRPLRASRRRHATDVA
jgi:hypothetical protein